jgi:hypothetical protein
VPFWDKNYACGAESFQAINQIFEGFINDKMVFFVRSFLTAKFEPYAARESASQNHGFRAGPVRF